MLTLNDGRSELWQWDTGRTITVDAECSQVHFSNKVFGRSIDVDVLDGVAIIPDVLLQTDKELIAWAFVGTSENGYTKISKVFKVNRRNKPSDYVFTPPEQTTLGEILERLDDLESVKVPDAIKNAVEYYLEQNPVEVPVQSVNGQTGEVKLTAGDVGAISQDDLQEATSEALAQAKASGEFDGVDGKDGTSATHSWNGTVLTITSASGTSSADLKGDPGEPGVDGSDYILTDADKTEIAEMAAELVEVPDSGGNVAYDEEQELTEEQKAQARANIGAQPVGEYLTEVPEGYAKNEDIKKVDRKVDTLREVVSKFHSNIVCDSKGEVINVSDASDMELAGLRIFGKTTQDGTPTPDAPVELVSVGDGGSVAVTIAGKNILNNFNKASGTSNGITWVANDDNSVTFNGTSTGDFTYLVSTKSDGLVLALGETYVLSGCPQGGNINTYHIHFWDYNENKVIRDFGNGCTFTFSEASPNYNVAIRIKPETTVDNLTFYPMLRLARISDYTYEPVAYKAITLSTPNGLPGIPVDSGGNYTDENGQQWICDEVDFAREVHIQSIEKIDSYAGETITGAYMSTTGKLSDGATVLYALPNPVEMPLSSEELTAYAALRTNYPNTTVFNDGGAGMEVKYVADTKLYIDKKFDELSAALLNQ